jgi:hypothetical protein
MVRKLHLNKLSEIFLRESLPLNKILQRLLVVDLIELRHLQKPLFQALLHDSRYVRESKIKNHQLLRFVQNVNHHVHRIRDDRKLGLVPFRVVEIVARKERLLFDVVLLRKEAPPAEKVPYSHVFQNQVFGEFDVRVVDDLLVSVVEGPALVDVLRVVELVEVEGRVAFVFHSLLRDVFPHALSIFEVFLLRLHYVVSHVPLEPVL